MILSHYFCLYFKAIVLIFFVHLSYFPTSTYVLNGLVSHI